ncbi:MAG: DUF1302 domain-containing protein [Pseudomonadales bacterium]
MAPGNIEGGRAPSSTQDEGNLNFEKGELFSLIFKGVHDLDLNYKDIGLFTRVKYWYDDELENGERPHGSAANDYVPNEELEDSDFVDLAQSSGFELLDLYAYASTELGTMPVEFRVGKQVVSWGESLFIQNSVNVINPVDVTALRKPGAELKEALLPVGLVYTNIGVIPDLSMELFYQYDWEQSVLDGCGSYWSGADISGGGCDRLTLQRPAGPDSGSAFLSRARDEKPSDDGQWGIALRYFAEGLNATEFGAYYINYHSRTPILSFINSSSPGTPFLLLPEEDWTQYFLEYPEDIEVFALTFAANIGSWAVSGELSHRPELPLAINTVEGTGAAAAGTFAPWSTMLDRALAAGPRGIVHGYDEVEFTQLQVTFINFFDQVLGAQRLSFAAEIGADWIDSLPDEREQRYGRAAVFGTGDFGTIQTPGGPVTCTTTGLPVSPNSQPQNCTSDGYITDFSWGYRIRASLDYSDAFWGINLTPSIAWSHDVKGYAPPPNFNEDSKALSLGLSAEYLNTYKADLSYTSFFGGDYNISDDRDFLSLSFSVAF